MRLFVNTELFPGISGGFEAGLQLTLTLWLVLKGVIPLDDILSVHWRRGSYGNYSPSIPLISAVSSLVSMVAACVRNIAITTTHYHFSYKQSNLLQEIEKC